MHRWRIVGLVPIPGKLAKLTVVSVTGLPLLAAGCGSGSESDSDPASQRPSEREVDAFLESLCSSALSCCVTIGRSEASVEDCTAQLKALSVGRTPRGYDPEAGDACLAALASAEQSGQCWALGLTPGHPCLESFGAHYGTSGPGEPCQDDSDCALPSEGTSICLRFSDTCQVLLPGKEGDGPCVAQLDRPDDVASKLDILYYGNESIATGYVCSHHDNLICGPSQTCEPKFTEGSACESREQCVSSLYCGDDICRPYLEPGATCAGEMGGGLCDAAGYCNAFTSTCEARLPPGSPCSENYECETDACIQDVCSAMSGDDLLTLGLFLCGPSGSI
jgi:hypothetical protein